MDIWTWIQTLGWIGIIAGIVFLAIWRGMILPELGSTGQMVSAVLGLVLLVGSATGLGWLEFGTTATTTDTAGGTPIYDVSATESLSYIVPIANTDSYEVRVIYNSTSGLIESQTEFVTVNFTIERTDNLPDLQDFTTCEVTDVGSFTAITGSSAGDTKDLIVLDSTGKYDVDWSKNSGSSTGVLTDNNDLSTSFPREKDHRDGWVLMNVTINPACIGLMSAVGDSTAFTTNIAGTPYTFIVRLATLNT